MQIPEEQVRTKDRHIPLVLTVLLRGPGWYPQKLSPDLYQSYEGKVRKNWIFLLFRLDASPRRYLPAHYRSFCTINVPLSLKTLPIRKSLF
jgi:hypothetical protein